MNNKTIIYGIVVLVVLAVLVFITINGKGKNVENYRSDTSLDQIMNTPNENEIEESEEITGVKTTTVSEGQGAEAKTGDTVSVNYTGRLENGTVFDSNVDPKFQHVEPFSFTLGEGRVIQGWDEGVVGMKVGEKRLLEISPEFGYGPVGIPGVIPGNAVLIFEVELLAIQ
ncbi:MAG TPA: FKBP-type peptidyl-prolyl cis-trans isomerase [Candidatus Paceibacterota bacterium]|nr:FKBP-type peptidyl-prolyl cis-trans isomerase [Candidatus Paceibacterota bacterium]